MCLVHDTALLMWAGTLADPWTISDAEFMRSLQTIIQTIAPDFEDLDDICPGQAIFYIVLLVLFIFRVTHIFLDRHLNNSAHGVATLDQPQSPLSPTSLSQIKKLACCLLNRSRGFALISWRASHFYIQTKILRNQRTFSSRVSYYTFLAMHIFTHVVVLLTFQN